MCEQKTMKVIREVNHQKAASGNLDRHEIRRMIFIYCKGLFSMIPWLSFLLSTLSLIFLAYLIPVIVRTVMDFNTPVFFGWVSIHLLIAIVVGVGAGFSLSYRVQKRMSVIINAVIRGEDIEFEDKELEIGFGKRMLLQSLRQGLALAVVLSLTGVAIMMSGVYLLNLQWQFAVVLTLGVVAFLVIGMYFWWSRTTKQKQQKRENDK